MGALYCLSAEAYGRWGEQAISPVPALAHERTRTLHPRLRRGTAMLLPRRWWGILGIGLQRGVAHVLLYGDGADLITAQLEPTVMVADLM